MGTAQGISEKRLLDTLIQLIKIDSPTGHEEEIGKELERRFKALGASTTMDEKGNLIARLEGTSEKEDWVLLSAHMDTAGTDRGIKPIIGEDGVLRSDGTTILGGDDKAGIAIILEMFQIYHDDPTLKHPGIEAVISVGEESGLRGSAALDKSQLKSTWGYVLDTSGPIGTIVYGAPWSRYLTITVNGKPSHAGIAPEKGVNAVAIFAKAAAQLPIGRVDAETVTNIASVQCDAVRNVVPSLLVATGMIRSLVKQNVVDLTDRFKKTFEDEAAALGGTIDFDVEDVYSGYDLDKHDKSFQMAEKAFKKLGFELHAKKSTGGTDANHYNGAGIKCAVVSVGQTEPHGVTESLTLQDMYDAAKVQLEILTLAGEDD